MLGYLIGGAIIGPYGVGLINEHTLHSVKHIAEVGHGCSELPEGLEGFVTVPATLHFSGLPIFLPLCG